MLKFNVIFLYLFVFCLSVASYAKEVSYEVSDKVNSSLNIRSGPGTIYSILRSIPNTEKNITIVDSKKLRKSTWVKIKHNDKYGWVNRVYLAETPLPSSTAKNKNAVDKMPVWLNTNGVYLITNIAPKRGQSMDTHMMFQLESTQARDLYAAIKSPVKLDKCTGANSKRTGKMICLHYEKTDTYECHFSINIKKQRVERGLPCDK